MVKRSNNKRLNDILEHLESHSKRLEGIEEQHLKNTGKIEKLEKLLISLHIIAIVLVVLELILYYTR